ncbi:hypothetical protein CLV33_102454 [Jejuia pallidilutea]|uniref:Uncharacterized protein n=1 Tax=Jejuia pallidilutea TaxID=504487 RepID=A0A362XFG4_9FLAO|nr:hypothetical protein [Jejuia pallidilutea]PQV50590.1 hypothetical protein CLV33_102454 [Jejuia pallidilutea]
MKKVLAVILVVVVVFIGLVYWSTSSTDKVFNTCSLLGNKNINEVDFFKYDSVLLIPNDMYKSDKVKDIIQGQQYRKAWSTPVKFPILFLDKFQGGVQVLEEGGGKQTHSLDIKDANGTVYTLRSINKDPEALVPEVLRVLNLENVVIDGISAQHPYGAILAAELADAVGIRHTSPKAVFLPKQENLGKYNEEYGNRLFLLEYETEGKINWTDIPNVIEIMDSDDLQKLKHEHGDKVAINKAEFIKTRLFDMVIGDWDRHGKQWGWIVEQKNDSFIAHPLAGDRDNAFFNIDGIVPILISNKYLVPEMRPFENDIDFFEGLVYPIDRYFLLNTETSVFVQQAEELQNSLTDSVIDNAFKVWPKPIAQLDQQEITEKLKGRRRHLKAYAKKFKQTIDELGALNKAIKGSEDENLPKDLIACFDCNL